MKQHTSDILALQAELLTVQTRRFSVALCPELVTLIAGPTLEVNTGEHFVALEQKLQMFAHNPPAYQTGRARSSAIW